MNCIIVIACLTSRASQANREMTPNTPEPLMFTYLGVHIHYKWFRPIA